MVSDLQPLLLKDVRPKTKYRCNNFVNIGSLEDLSKEAKQRKQNYSSVLEERLLPVVANLEAVIYSFSYIFH